MLWCLPDDCARGPVSNQAVQSLGTVVTDCHVLGAFSLQRQQRQKVGADHPCWRWPTVTKLLVQLQRVRSAIKQETELRSPEAHGCTTVNSWLINDN